ncbi:Heterochromatin protein 1c [Serendipita sp. 399]|nr:Heterochromatin protein 1c [Serendipita sp. 399]
MPREIRKRQESTDEDEVQRQIVDSDAGDEAENNTEKEEVEDGGDEEEYEIERIIHVKKTKGGGVEYLVKWLGYPDSENSWVPEADCTAPELIQEFNENRAKEKAKKLGKGVKAGEDAVMADGTKPARKKSIKGDSKSVTSGGRSRTFQEVNQEADEDDIMDENGRSTDAYAPMNDHQHLADWSDIIDEVMTVDHVSSTSKAVTYFMRLKDGSLRSAPSHDMVQRAALLVIAFYERNLRFAEDT